MEMERMRRKERMKQRCVRVGEMGVEREVTLKQKSLLGSVENP